MKPGTVQTYLPPPPHKIVEYLNGHVIGHYVMKKALSVAIYNHFCNVNFSRDFTTSDSDVVNNNENGLVEDAKHYFDRKGPSVSKLITDEEIPVADDSPHNYMSPVVARVIIEAASHRVRLRRPNTLTFDSTGPSKPVNAICSTIAQFFEIPYVRCDCSMLGPMTPVKESMTSNCSLPIINNRCLQLKQDSIDDTADHPAASAQSGRRRGSFSHALLSGGSSPSETINTVIAKLFRKADYDLGKAQRGIVFLDGMDKIGSNVSGGKAANKQVLREILQTIDGTTVDVTRVGSEDNEVIDTSHIFFVCFGNFDYDIDGIGKSSLHVKGSASVKSGESRLLWKSVMEHEAVHPKSDDSTDSGNGSEEHKTNSNHRRDSSMSIDTHSSGHYSDGFTSDEDDSFQGLKECELAQQLVDESKTSPILHYQSLWGMKDVELKFQPEALEVIANQATIQGAGREGVEAILEKLFLTIKFDILGSDVVAVEVTEDAVLGKEPAIYHRKPQRKKSKVVKPGGGGLYAISEETNGNSSVSGKSHTNFTTRLTDFDMAILDQLEV